MADDNDTTRDESIAAEVDRIIAEREAEAARKRDRSKQPKDFGEFLDRVADAVIDRVSERRAAAEREAETADQEPSRGGESGGFSKWWGGN